MARATALEHLLWGLGVHTADAATIEAAVAVVYHDRGGSDWLAGELLRWRDRCVHQRASLQAAAMLGCLRLELLNVRGNDAGSVGEGGSSAPF